MPYPSQDETEQVFSILHMFNSLKELVQRKKDQLAELEKKEKSLKEKSAQ